MVAFSQDLPIAKDCYRPILLKKSAMVCASKKYASEIEIFTFGRGFRTRTSRSSVQKRRFHQSMIRQFGQTDFFNRIGQKRPEMLLENQGDSNVTFKHEKFGRDHRQKSYYLENH
ncbi:hypothetical protein ACS73_19865 [Pseudomonas lini]|nr:hypothetical protein ACS73_19865 [Pseudomonas lini]